MARNNAKQNTDVDLVNSEAIKVLEALANEGEPNSPASPSPEVFRQEQETLGQPATDTEPKEVDGVVKD
jgi:hypothetical protein